MAPIASNVWPVLWTVTGIIAAVSILEAVAAAPGWRFLTWIWATVRGVLAIGIGVGVGIWATQTFAHEAPLGWRYDISCCHEMDCKEIPTEAVREMGDGYHITLTPEQHSQLVVPAEYVISYSDTRIKDAPDGMFHACIGKQFIRDNGETHGGNLICLYVPPRGF